MWITKPQQQLSMLPIPIPKLVNNDSIDDEDGLLAYLLFAIPLLFSTIISPQPDGGNLDYQQETMRQFSVLLFLAVDSDKALAFVSVYYFYFLQFLRYYYRILFTTISEITKLY